MQWLIFGIFFGIDRCRRCMQIFRPIDVLDRSLQLQHPKVKLKSIFKRRRTRRRRRQQNESESNFTPCSRHRQFDSEI